MGRIWDLETSGGHSGEMMFGFQVFGIINCARLLQCSLKFKKKSENGSNMGPLNILRHSGRAHQEHNTFTRTHPSMTQHWEQLGPRCISQTHLCMQTLGVGGQTADLLITGRQPQPPETLHTKAAFTKGSKNGLCNFGKNTLANY